MGRKIGSCGADPVHKVFQPVIQFVIQGKGQSLAVEFVEGEPISPHAQP
jgi:hypothetical protein